MNERLEQMEEKQIQQEDQQLCVTCDDKCCAHCKYYDGDGYCVSGWSRTATRPSDYCSSFSWAY